MDKESLFTSRSPAQTCGVSLVAIRRLLTSLCVRVGGRNPFSNGQVVTMCLSDQREMGINMNRA